MQEYREKDEVRHYPVDERKYSAPLVHWEKPYTRKIVLAGEALGIYDKDILNVEHLTLNIEEGRISCKKRKVYHFA